MFIMKCNHCEKVSINEESDLVYCLSYQVKKGNCMVHRLLIEGSRFLDLFRFREEKEKIYKHITPCIHI